MKRLDRALVERGLCESREKARRAVMAGLVRINDRLASKPSDSVQQSDTLLLAGAEKYVGRGGWKLEHALRHFQIEAHGLSAIDLGASTGGFTDCLLQHGAARVYAIDVGHNQIVWQLRQDPRVVVLEGVNARNLDPDQFAVRFDLATIDVSFISLAKILPSVHP